MIEISCDWHGTETNGAINTAQLIIEVEVRPMLYDRGLQSSFSAREVLRIWSEVARSVQATRGDCLRTWRKLLKTFRYFQRTSMVLLEQWSFWQQMQFLLPYAKNDELTLYEDGDQLVDWNNIDAIPEDDVDEDDNRDDDEADDDGDEDEQDNRDQKQQMTATINRDRSLPAPAATSISTITTSSNSASVAAQELKPNIVGISAAASAHADSTRNAKKRPLTAQEAVAIAMNANVGRQRSGAEAADDICIDTDSKDVHLPPAVLKYDFAMDNEELFLLSFAPNLMRLTPKQNALARMRILEELYKLEFE